MSTKGNRLLVLPTAATQAPEQPKEKKKRKGRRDDGRSQVAVSLGRDVTGERIRKIFYGRTYAEAKEKADTFKREIAAGINLDLLDVDLKDWVERCRPRYNAGREDQTVAWHDRNLNALVAAFPGRTVRSILPMELQVFLDEKEGETYSSISKRRQAMEYVFGQAVINGVVLRNPVTDLENPDAAEDGTHRALVARESNAILEGWQLHDYGLCAVIMRFSGLRPQEALALDLQKDIDLANTVICIDKAYKFGTNQSKMGLPKSKAGYRDAPITEPLLSILRWTLLNEPTRTAVYTPPAGGPITRQTVRRGWEGFTEAVGVVAQQYDLRHTFATEVDDLQLVRDSTLQYWMGHKASAKESVTKRVYIHKKRERIEADKKLLQAHMAEQYKAFTARLESPYG